MKNLWFVLLQFEYKNEWYILLSYNISDQVFLTQEIAEQSFYTDQHEFDGPKEWLDDMLSNIQECLIDIEVDLKLGIDHPIYNVEDLRMVINTYDKVLTNFNLTYVELQKI